MSSIPANTLVVQLEYNKQWFVDTPVWWPLVYETWFSRISDTGENERDRYWLSATFFVKFEPLTFKEQGEHPTK